MPSFSADPVEAGARWRIVRVDRTLLPAAAQRLVQASPAAGPDAATQFLSAARTHDVDLGRMWASVEARPDRHDAVREVCLVVPGAGRTAMFFTSRPDSERRLNELGAVIGHSGEHCADAARVGQALLETREETLAPAFEAGGFRRIARLWYLVRPRPAAEEFPRPEPRWPEGVTVRHWGEGDDPALVRALERSYVDTLDCPELSRIRRPAEVLESHRASGRWESRLWWLVRRAGRPEGAMLFNPSASSGTIELVYLGLSPSLRGEGLGASLLTFGLSHLIGRSEQTVTCAVDQRNAPACRLYERFGFVRFEERLALVRELTESGG